jgi:hypothetical protein
MNVYYDFIEICHAIYQTKRCDIFEGHGTLKSSQYYFNYVLSTETGIKLQDE